MERPEVTPYNREHYKVESVDKSGFYTYVPKKGYSELRAQEMCFFINMKPDTIHKLVCYKCKICGQWHLGHHGGKEMDNDEKEKIKKQYQKWKIVHGFIKNNLN